MEEYSILDAFKALNDVEKEVSTKSIKPIEHKELKEGVDWDTMRKLKNVGTDKILKILKPMISAKRYNYLKQNPQLATIVNDLGTDEKEKLLTKLNETTPKVNEGVKIRKAPKHVSKVSIKESKSLKEDVDFSDFEEFCQGNMKTMIKVMNELKSGNTSSSTDLMLDKMGWNDLSNDGLKAKIEELDKLVTSALYDSGDYSNEEIKEFEKLMESKKLKEEPELEPQYDSRKSFYNKAYVDEKGDNYKVLYSYGTPVVRIKDDKVTLLRKGYLGWSSSQTTLRHVKEFLKQNGFKSGSLKELQKMYPTEQASLGESLDNEKDMQKELDFTLNAIAKGSLSVDTIIKDLAEDEEHYKSLMHSINNHSLNYKDVIKNLLEKKYKQSQGERFMKDTSKNIESSIDDLISKGRITPKELVDYITSKYLKEKINENYSEDDEGWDMESLQELRDVFTDIDRLSYEIDNCVRGSYSDCHTYKELSKYVKQLAKRLRETTYSFENNINFKNENLIKSKKQKSLKEGEVVNLNDKDDVAKGKKFIKSSENENIEQVVDVDAETVDKLKDSYIGNVILQCPTCRTNLYKKPEDLEKSEDLNENGEVLYNVEEICPHCGNKGGFELVGQVASLDVEQEEPESTTGAPDATILDDEQEEKELNEPKEITLDDNDEIKVESLNKEKEIIVEDIDEVKFDTIVNRYLNATYSNVDNYKTLNGSVDDDKNKIVVEGIIKYKSGKQLNTKFILEAKEVTKNNKYVFNGFNETFSKSKKAFNFSFNLNKNNLVCETLKYKYNTKVLNENKVIKGKINLNESKKLK